MGGSVIPWEDGKSRRKWKLLIVRGGEKHTVKSKVIHRAMTCLWSGGVSEPSLQMSAFQVALPSQNQLLIPQSKLITSSFAFLLNSLNLSLPPALFGPVCIYFCTWLSSVNETQQSTARKTMGYGISVPGFISWLRCWWVLCFEQINHPVPQFLSL